MTHTFGYHDGMPEEKYPHVEVEKEVVTNRYIFLNQDVSIELPNAEGVQKIESVEDLSDNDVVAVVEERDRAQKNLAILTDLRDDMQQKSANSRARGTRQGLSVAVGNGAAGSITGFIAAGLIEGVEVSTDIIFRYASIGFALGALVTAKFSIPYFRKEQAERYQHFIENYQRDIASHENDISVMDAFLEGK